MGRLFETAEHGITHGMTAAQRTFFFGSELKHWSEYRDLPLMGKHPTYHDSYHG